MSIDVRLRHVGDNLSTSMRKHRVHAGCDSLATPEHSSEMSIARASFWFHSESRLRRIAAFRAYPDLRATVQHPQVLVRTRGPQRCTPHDQPVLAHVVGAGVVAERVVHDAAASHLASPQQRVVLAAVR